MTTVQDHVRDASHQLLHLITQLTTVVKIDNVDNIEPQKEELPGEMEEFTYDPTLYAPFRSIGGQGGGQFKWVHGKKGLFVTKIQTWAGGHTLRGISLTMSNGQRETFGKEVDRYAGEINFAAGERVTALSVWSNSDGNRCGSFRLKTSMGQTYFPKSYFWDPEEDGTEYVMDIGSGFLCGAYGRCGLDVDGLGFAFYRSVECSKINPDKCRV